MTTLALVAPDATPMHRRRQENTEVKAGRLIATARRQFGSELAALEALFVAPDQEDNREDVQVDTIGPDGVYVETSEDCWLVVGAILRGLTGV